MSRATVRAAVKAYLDTPAVAGLRAVYPAKPRNWRSTDFQFDRTLPSSAAGYVHIERVLDRRAATGKRFLDYDVALVFVMRSSRSGPTAGTDTMADYDALVEAVKARLRVRPPLGLGDGSIFQAAERLLEDVADLPQDEAAISEVWGVIRFDVSEWITA